MQFFAMTFFIYFSQALACIFGGVAHFVRHPPPPPKINFLLIFLNNKISSVHYFCGNFVLRLAGNSGTIVKSRETKFTKKRNAF